MGTTSPVAEAVAVALEGANAGDSGGDPQLMTSPQRAIDHNFVEVGSIPANRATGHRPGRLPPGPPLALGPNLFPPSRHLQPAS